MKIVISGGHPSPALALIDYLRAHHPEVEIAFIGREIALAATGQKALEADAMEARQIPFYPLVTGRFGHGGVADKLKASLAFAQAVSHMYTLLGKLRPTVFVSFGSYVAAPIAVASKLRHIPIITHEQTRVAGVSNRAIALIADRVAISYLESASYFPAQKTVVTGLPLRPQLFEGEVHQPSWFTAAADLPLLYISGGSTGSQAINQVVLDSLPELVAEWQIIHTCGKSHNHHNWVVEMASAAKKLPANLQKRYHVVEHVTAAELRWIYHQHTLVTGRAGANTVAELHAFDIPALFIPLPNSHYDEQTANAQSRAAEGRAVLLSQDQLNKRTFLELLGRAKKLLSAPRKEVTQDRKATEKLWELVHSVSAHDKIDS
jgi:UDP-N-acetylglucosamine--N-acetylmuramyl-(pentapeptide) pyrophosphoryl-undecaprenol N-acetylglucosamine transferase